MTKDQIKGAPDYDADSWNDDSRTHTGTTTAPTAS